ncbi:MAG: hypothetical protein AAB805_01030 [Patescibacteria group bacterium]
MSKRLFAALIALSLALSDCGQPLSTNHKTYPTYGLFNESTDKSKDVCYKVSVGNVVWSIILIETIVAPIYFVGFSLYNPMRMKKDANDQCSYDS